MFDYFFKYLNNLNSETKLLEACEWDEERVVVVRSHLESSLEKIFDEKYSYPNFGAIKKKLSHHLGEDLHQQEIDIVLEILEESLESTTLSGKKYEN
tara:strand:- start:558 stop:848 length:291 start_codon:yes stop_codon:yes gene_type:complete